MGLCIDLGYEVVTDTVTVGVSPPDAVTYRLTAPTGKKPVSGGVKNPTSPNLHSYNNVISSYPDGNDWVFVFLQPGTSSYDVDIYAVCVNV